MEEDRATAQEKGLCECGAQSIRRVVYARGRGISAGSNDLLSRLRQKRATIE